MHVLCVCLKSASGEGGGHASLPILFGGSQAKKVENHYPSAPSAVYGSNLEGVRDLGCGEGGIIVG